MPFEGRQRAAVIDRCWSIYLSISRAFSVPENFHVEFPAAVESAIITGSLHFTASVGDDHRTDYRRRLLSHPPHHLHDQRNLILSFSGDVQDFIARAREFLSLR